ncbi:ATP-binding cassette domain-containing protein [Micromonospora sp. Llam7]|uniref:ATP-binding cassette domain-containing protein n=1 Tax=Micromonospora tarapacensis TaxID=2835305 RepID=UPI001C82E38F|nr:ATP-binding cassette domain-containing protein [Micromonospora tarapacensis]MBX7266366.1 ATP-binding cassette domain-containing protein [Micromonospora tarapacensis]
MRSQREAIVCRSLTKRYNGRTVVDDVSFEVTAGTIAGFVGANGAGKTTTMRMLLGLVGPTSGMALIDGRPYRELANPRRQVGAVVDGPGAHPGHSAKLHLSVLATSSGLAQRRVDEVLDLVELTEHAGRRVGGFSMGMLQRLAIAGALLGDPGVLVLDEPANGLDPPGILWMRDLLRRLAADGRALLISSHLLAELAEVVNRVVIIDRGRLVADKQLDQLLDGTRVVEMRCADVAAMLRAVTARDLRADLDSDLLVIHGMSAREAGELAAAAGAGPVHWLTERTSSFEDVYFRLAGSLADTQVPA